MKNYFNANERTKHIILLAMQTVADDFSAVDSITDEERKYLRMATTYIKKFNNSVFERFGEPYRRKIINTMQMNHLKLVGKFENTQDCITEAAAEDLIPKLRDVQMFYCMDCQKENHKDCAIYAMCVSCGIDGDDTDGCPYKL